MPVAQVITTTDYPSSSKLSDIGSRLTRTAPTTAISLSGCFTVLLFFGDKQARGGGLLATHSAVLRDRKCQHVAACRGPGTAICRRGLVGVRELETFSVVVVYSRVDYSKDERE